MNKDDACRITTWIRRQAFDRGGPRYLSPTLYALFRRLNHNRRSDWDVEATLAASLPGAERLRRIEALSAEFSIACCTHLTPDQQEQLLSEILSGAYDEPGPRLHPRGGTNPLAGEVPDEVPDCL